MMHERDTTTLEYVTCYCPSGELSTVSFLLDATVPHDDKQILLKNLAMIDNVAVFKLLCKYGYRLIDLQNNYAGSNLSLIIECGAINMLQYMADRSCDLVSIWQAGNPIYTAIVHNTPAIVPILLKIGFVLETNSQIFERLVGRMDEKEWDDTLMQDLFAKCNHVTTHICWLW